MLFGFEGERVNADFAIGGDTLVVLVGLDELVVRSGSGGGSVVTVELEVSIVVSRSSELFTSVFGPDELFDGVVEVKFDFGRHGFITGELELFNEILVGDLGESA